LLPEYVERAHDNAYASGRARAYADLLDRLDVPMPPIMAA